MKRSFLFITSGGQLIFCWVLIKMEAILMACSSRLGLYKIIRDIVCVVWTLQDGYLTNRINDIQFRDAAKEEDDSALLRMMSNYGMHCNKLTNNIYTEVYQQHENNSLEFSWQVRKWLQLWVVKLTGQKRRSRSLFLAFGMQILRPTIRQDHLHDPQFFDA